MTSENMARLIGTLKKYFTLFHLVPTCYITAIKLRNTRVPKLQLGSPDSEALGNCSLRCSTSCIHAVVASRDGKLELPALNFQAGAWELAQQLRRPGAQAVITSFPRSGVGMQTDAKPVYTCFAAPECLVSDLINNCRILAPYAFPRRSVGTRNLEIFDYAC